MKTVGLVLEGGGFRGTYTAGVLDAFLEEKITFPYIVGISAGVCNALSYLSEQSGRSAKINIEHCNDKSYCGLGNFIKTGSIFNDKMLFDDFPHRLYPFDYDTYEKNCQQTKLLAGVTDCDTGEAVYYEINDPRNQYDIVKASIWLPFVSKIVEYDGRKLLDGGTADSIPIKKAMADGCDKNVIILTQPSGYQKKPSKTNKLARVFYRKYPKLAQDLITRHQVYNDTLVEIDRLEQEGKAFVIRPSEKLNVSRLEQDPKKLEAIYELGLQDGKKKIAHLKDFLAE